jgi:hypothetical protein
VRPDRLGDSGPDGYPADDPGGAVPVQPLPIGAAEDRPVHAFADLDVLARCRLSPEQASPAEEVTLTAITA